MRPLSSGIDEGRAQAGLVISPDFQTRVDGAEAEVLLLIDGSDVFTSQTAYNAITAIAQTHTTGIVWSQLERAGHATPRQRPPTSRHAGPHLVQSRSCGLDLPHSRDDHDFQVPFQGSFWAFTWLTFMYIFSGLGLGLLVSTASENQKQSQQQAMLIMLVGLVLGGFIFLGYLMPPWVRIIGNLFPLTYFIPIARGIMTKGMAVPDLWEHIAALVIYVILMMGLAIRAFRTEME